MIRLLLRLLAWCDAKVEARLDRTAVDSARSLETLRRILGEDGR